MIFRLQINLHKNEEASFQNLIKKMLLDIIDDIDSGEKHGEKHYLDSGIEYQFFFTEDSRSNMSIATRALMQAQDWRHQSENKDLIINSLSDELKKLTNIDDAVLLDMAKNFYSKLPTDFEYLSAIKHIFPMRL